MTFKEIYKKTIEFWPSEIDISDGKDIVAPDTGTFDILLKIWDITVEKTESESEFIKIMVWGIFCGLHKQAMELNIIGKNKVALAELDIDYVKHKFEESLFDPEYKYYKEIQPEYTPE